MSVTVTVVDEQTGEVEVVRIADGDYVVIPVAPCVVGHAQKMGPTTHQVTIKGHAPQPLPELPGPTAVVDPDGELEVHGFGGRRDAEYLQQLCAELDMVDETSPGDDHEVVAEWTRAS